MSKSSGNGTTRGDRRRNARRERLRAMLPRDGVVVGIDLAEQKQALAVVDHDVRVLARKTVKVKAFRLGGALDWAVGQARAKGFTAVTVACEPTGPRCMQVQRLCGERGLPLVSHIAREQQDYTPHKTDEADCVMIARLAVEPHCYVPEDLDETWAHLRLRGDDQGHRRGRPGRRAGQHGITAGHRRRGPRAPRQGPGRVRCLPAALDLFPRRPRPSWDPAAASGAPAQHAPATLPEAA